jgi:peptidoglycan/xylan/chitin deacetylase (PgdA/CDA1 family)
VKDILRNYARKGYYGLRRAAGHATNSLGDKGPKLLVLTYHRVLEERRDNPLKTITSLKMFLKQIDYLAMKFGIIGIDEAFKDFSSDDPGAAKPSVVLSFDDGTIDNYEVVFPALKKKGLPAAFFVSSGYIGSGRPPWDLEVIMKLVHNPGIDRVQIGAEELFPEKGEPRLSFAYRVAGRLKYAGADALRRTVEGLKSDFDFRPDRCMEWEHLKKLQDSGMEIGSHGITHRSLARIPAEDAGNEIVASKKELAARLGRECRYFSFPFGSALDYNDGLISLVRGSGYRGCLLNVHGYNRPSGSLFSLKRIIMDDDTPYRFILG